VSGFPLPPPEVLPANGRGGSHVFGLRCVLDEERARRDGLWGDRRNAGVVPGASLGKRGRMPRCLLKKPSGAAPIRSTRSCGSSAALRRSARREAPSNSSAGHDCERRLMVAGTPACMDSTSGGRHARLGAKLTASGLRCQEGRKPVACALGRRPAKCAGSETRNRAVRCRSHSRSTQPPTWRQAKRTKVLGVAPSNIRASG
jgi:hypothetical protein